MSTAGKVLSVLVMLMAIVWVLLSATVTQLNRNWAKLQHDRVEALAKLETDVAKVDTDLVTNKDLTFQEQAVTDNEITAIHSRQADLERSRSKSLESLSRAKINLGTMESTLKASIAGNEQRLADREVETKALADAKANVAKLTADNSELLAQLSTLRDKFKTALNTNREKAGLPALNLGQ